MLIVLDSKIPFAETAFKRIGEIRLLKTSDISSKAVANADALVVRSETKVDRQILDGSKVKFVGTSTIGFDHVDREYLSARHIGFASAPGSNAMSVADYILAALLEVEAVKNFSLRGKSIGIVGFGNTGSRTAGKAKALGMQVLLNDPPLQRATGDEKFHPLDELMSCDVLSLHVPLTRSGEDPTFHLFDEKRIRSMKKGSILINTSRGSVVETQGLRKSLDNEQLLGAVLDVWENEPAIDAGLLKRTLLGTPHIAGYSVEGKITGARMIYESLCIHFALNVPWDVPTDAAGTMNCEIPEKKDDENAIRALVRQVYDIRRDDELLRKTLEMPVEEHGAYFRKLRASYPVRHEFSAARVSTGAERGSLRGTLSSLGFSVR
ncbi:MAG TPA: 4-phosphoerythronate dehydrogenase [Bacteroidota bacterium]